MKTKILVDHVDHNGLNCQKYNIREATSSQNNSNKVSKSTTNYLGVSIFRKKYRVQITHNKITHYLGCYNNVIEAAKVYDIKAW